jgi:hypothetical protein
MEQKRLVSKIVRATYGPKGIRDLFYSGFGDSRLL